MSRQIVDTGAARLVEALLAVVGRDQLRAVLLFGSRLVQASPDGFSAYDLVVVCERYRLFYTALARSGVTRRSPALMAALNRVLAPNVIAFAPNGWEDGPVAKIMVVERDAFERALAPSGPDHFLKGRMVQRTSMLDSRDAEEERWIESLLQRARADVLRWAGPCLKGPFTAERLAQRMLELSYAGEIRPETTDRVRDIFDAQRGFLVRVFAGVLEEAVEQRQLVRAEGPGAMYRFTRPPGRLRCLWIRFYFLRSKVRATARWLKHSITFENWMDYITRKIQRRIGMQIVITPWERRLPYLLLWPKMLRVLRRRRVARRRP